MSNQPVAVKICGIMTPEHADAAVEAGADFIGLVFAPSRRQISLQQARPIVAALRASAARSSRQVAVVGVFVNEAPATIERIVADLGLDLVQLSGHEASDLPEQLSRPVIKAIRFDGDPSEAGWLERTESAGRPVMLLVDAHVGGSFGGAGVTGDWQRAAEVAHRRPIWLAGGLTPANVAAAIAAVRPHAVDVSSGVETEGRKDIAKIYAFVRAAKGSERASASGASGMHSPWHTR